MKTGEVIFQDPTQKEDPIFCRTRILGKQINRMIVLAPRPGSKNLVLRLNLESWFLVGRGCHPSVPPLRCPIGEVAPSRSGNCCWSPVAPAPALPDDRYRSIFFAAMRQPAASGAMSDAPEKRFSWPGVMRCRFPGADAAAFQVRILAHLWLNRCSRSCADLA
jgi:hypothetical protein